MTHSQAIQLPSGFTLNAEMQHCVDLVKAGKNVFITGNAGTGKSTLLTYLRENYLPQDAAIVAPTGVGAINVDGITLHRLCGFNIDVTFEHIASRKYYPRTRDVMKAVTVLVIDEVSMVRADMMDYVDQAFRRFGKQKGKPFGGAQLIFIGDLAQLPPVVASQEESDFLESRYESEFFFDSSVMQEIEFETINLKTIYRQEDPELISALNAIRKDSAESEHFSFLKTLVSPDFEAGVDDFYITLATTNRKADEINGRHLEGLEGQQFSWSAKIHGTISNSEKPNADILYFKKNSQIMLINNDPEQRWANGTLATITEVHMDDTEEAPHVMIRIQGEAVDQRVDVLEWEILRPTFSDGALKYEVAGTFHQFPFILAWAVTIHKSQGKTFENVIVDLSQKAFSPGQLYVALSRCRTAAGIVLRQEITNDQILVHHRVTSFMNELDE